MVFLWLPQVTPARPYVRAEIQFTVRFVFLDTHWWLQAPSGPAKNQVLTKVEDALRTADGRHVIVAAHHPFASGGAHGGPMPVWEGLGILWLLRKTGSLVQDLNATVYRDLLEGLQGVFARVGKPLIFAGGHDHSLQVVEKVEDNVSDGTHGDDAPAPSGETTSQPGTTGSTPPAAS